jgi:hypothetical protein
VGTSTRRTPSRRALVAIGVLLLWVAGLGFLARRELFRPRLERLTEAGLRINQYTSFYALRENNQLIGYASSVVDTTTTEITITDQMIRELTVRRVAGRLREVRASKSAKTRLTRTFKLKDFEWRTNTGALDLRASGRVDGDSLIYSVKTNDKPPVTGSIKLDGPVLVPNLVPHAIALMNDPQVGRKYTLPVFDPSRQAIVQVISRIERDTTFVLSDSAVLDTVTRVWKPIRLAEIKAWYVSSSPGGFNGWLDETGHIVQTDELDARVTRSTIEEAFENWMVRVNQRRRAAGLLPPVDSTPIPAPPPVGRGKRP